MGKAMDIKWMQIEDVKPYENNPRVNDNAVEYVAESLEQLGWKQPIVVDENNVIVVGHTRYKAAQSLGMEKVPVLIADDLAPDQIKAYRIADNKTSDFSIWDNKLLLKELENIPDDIFTGFNTSELFDSSVDLPDNSVVVNNEAGIQYEVTFKSEDPTKIDQIKELWERICDE